MPTNVKIARRELRQWFDYFEGEVRDFAIQVGTAALVGTIDKTPVAYGEAINGWVVSIGAGAPQHPGFLGFDKTGRTAKARGIGVLRTMPRSPVSFHLANFTPQAEILEHGLFDPSDPGPSKRGHPPGQRVGEILVRGGYSTQAPQGMLAVTIAEVRQRFGP